MARQGLEIPEEYKNDEVVWARKEKIKDLKIKGFKQVGIVFHELNLLVKIAKKIIKKEVAKKVVKTIAKKVNKK